MLHPTSHFFFFNDTATTEIYTLSLHDALPISSHKPILRIVQPYANHNGGLVMFGPDGMLYIGIDRKSTRLNSSHSQISYAVFCLKKKKKKNNNIDPYIYNYENKETT